MCGRYELHSHPATIALTFGLAHPPDVNPHFNIAPMTEIGPLSNIVTNGPPLRTPVTESGAPSFRVKPAAVKLPIAVT